MANFKENRKTILYLIDEVDKLHVDLFNITHWLKKQKDDYDQPSKEINLDSREYQVADMQELIDKIQRLMSDLEAMDITT